MRLRGTIQNYAELCRTIQNHTELRQNMDCIELYGALRNCMEICKAALHCAKLQESRRNLTVNPTHGEPLFLHVLFDDIPQNLFTAADLGLKTVQVYNKKLDKELNGRSKKIDYMTNNLKEWLQKWIQNN